MSNDDPERTAKYISALSNSAALCGRSFGYLVWGVDDSTHGVVGTDFSYRDAKKGGEELEAWLSRMVNPKIGFSFHEMDMGGGVHATVLEVPRASREPTRFGSAAYVRVGSNLKPLVGYAELEARFWRSFDTTPDELKAVARGLTEDGVAGILDYAAYYDSLGLPIPARREKAFEDLSIEKFVAKNDSGSWDVTAFGALMIARDLADFDALAMRAVRVIRYCGTNRLEAEGERDFSAGYASSYEDVVRHIMDVTPREEVLDGPIRRQRTAFPEVAVRELLANALVHQDLAQRGTSPMVEVFDDRVEFTNPGAPLIPLDRFVDLAPASRNEKVASFMRKCGICEQRGSGYDKVIASTSEAALLAPKVENQAGMFTKATLYARLPFERTSKADRVRTCYMLACLASVNSSAIGDADVRKAFGLDGSRGSSASKDDKGRRRGGPHKAGGPRHGPALHEVRALLVLEPLTLRNFPKSPFWPSSVRLENTKPQVDGVGEKTLRADLTFRNFPSDGQGGGKGAAASAAQPPPSRSSGSRSCTGCGTTPSRICGAEAARSQSAARIRSHLAYSLGYFRSRSHAAAVQLRPSAIAASLMLVSSAALCPASAFRASENARCSLAWGWLAQR